MRIRGFKLPKEYNHSLSLEQCFYQNNETLYSYSPKSRLSFQYKDWETTTLTSLVKDRPQPIKYIAKLLKATVTGHCGVVDSSNKVPSIIISSADTHTENRVIIADQLVQNTKYLNIIGSQANDKFTLGCKNKFVQNNKKGQYLLLTSIADIAFSHFVFDSFTKLLVLPNKSLLEELKIIVNESIKPYQVSFLTEFGISNENIIKKPYNEDWLCEQLLVIQQPASNNNYITPAYFHMLRNYLLSTYPPDYKKPWPSRVYLDRDDERSQMRAIVNEAELKAIAIKHGFTVLTPGKLSFADKVAMFANADCIIGQYGGGLQFGVTCPPHSKWLVLQSPHFYRHQINLHSALLPMDVLNLTGDAVEAKPKYLNNDPFKVDAQSFEAALVAHFN